MTRRSFIVSTIGVLAGLVCVKKVAPPASAPVIIPRLGDPFPIPGELVICRIIRVEADRALAVCHYSNCQWDQFLEPT